MSFDFDECIDEDSMSVWEMIRDICRSRALVWLVIHDAGHIVILTLTVDYVEWAGQ